MEGERGRPHALVGRPATLTPDQQQQLLGPVQPGTTVERAVINVHGSGHAMSRMVDDDADRLDRGVRTNPGLWRVAHPVQRLAVQDPLGVRPAQCGSQHPDPRPDGGVGPASVPPGRAGGP